MNNAILYDRGDEFLRRYDLKQKIRRELSFGLFPKTLKGLRILVQLNQQFSASHDQTGCEIHH